LRKTQEPLAPKCNGARTGPTHIPVLAEKVLELLACSPGEVVVDATVGGGGHAELILERIGPAGLLIGIDCDQTAIERAGEHLRSKSNVVLVRDNFRNIASILESMRLTSIDALLLDLGLSSFQLDEPARGFSFRTASQLDMRMDTRLKTTSADIINTYSEKQIAQLLKEYGEEPFARKIAATIVRQRAKAPIRTTTELAEIVRSCIPAKSRRPRIDPATKTFQAFRIEVNHEIENLRKVLDDGIQLLGPQGRICVISFHSLEDRIVKQAFMRASRGCICPPELPRCVCGKKPVLKILTRKPIRPSSEEINTNPRCRSARLRAAERVTAEAGL
jgi:16S rRNA (cytosine1402-N4)-methyltransferase